MEQVIQVLQAKADYYYKLYRIEMERGSAEWAIKYENMWYGVLAAERAVRELQDKAKRVVV